MRIFFCIVFFIVNIFIWNQGFSQKKSKPGKVSTISTKVNRPKTNPGQYNIGYDCFDEKIKLKLLLRPMNDEDKNFARGDFQSFQRRYNQWMKADGFSVSENSFKYVLEQMNLLNESNRDTCFGLRIHCALSNESSPKLYLVFFKEYKLKDSAKPYTKKDTAFVLHSDDNGFRLSTDLETDTLAIKRFNSKYSKILNLKSFSFTIKELNYMFNDRNFISEAQRSSSSYEYGVYFAPAYHYYSEENKLYFVAQPEKIEIRNRRNRFTIDDASWYNHNDPCPDKCPENEIKN